MIDPVFKKEIEQLAERKADERIRKLVPELLRSSTFITRKITDTPTDGNAVVPRKYVTMNGSVAGRPTSVVAIVGQFYLPTDTNIPMWYTTGGWRNGSGSIVALA